MRLGCIAYITFSLLFAQSAIAESVLLENQGGVYVLPVRINDTITLKFTLDTGASDVTIPADVASTLFRAGALSAGDVLGKADYVLADGSKERDTKILLRKIQIGTQSFQDVPAVITSARGELLLGQSFLKRLSSWSIDNSRHQLTFGDADGAPAGTSTSNSPSQIPAVAELDEHCYSPQPPPRVDGATASASDMRIAIAAFQEFQTASDDYQRCIVAALARLKSDAAEANPPQAIDPSIVQRSNDLIDMNQRLKERSGGELNQEIAAYRARVGQ
jgi:clan AA aspartic protease (TIGR02281 family)